MIDNKVIFHCYRLFLKHNMNVWIDKNYNVMIQYFRDHNKYCHISSSEHWSKSMKPYILDKR